MPYQSDKLAEFLLQGNFISSEELKKAQELAEKEQKMLADILVGKEFFKDEEIGKIIADIYGWNFIDLQKQSIDSIAIRLIPESVALKQHALIFSQSPDNIKIAMNNPNDIAFIHLLQKNTGQRIIAYYATLFDLQEKIHLYKQEISGKFIKLLDAYQHEQLGEKVEDSAIVQMVDLLLHHAYNLKASDIHIDPKTEGANIRFRIDGILQDIVSLPNRKIHNLVVTRLKIMAKLRTDEHQTPQDGKIECIFTEGVVDIRVSIVPSTKGETVVMRVLAETVRQFTLEELGLSKNDYKKLENNIKKPWGMILATGPTGSGKTTTLYAILKILNTREVNIATIEDPVEYGIDGITQIQVNAKTDLTFASGLRSIVRQDPDIIMVGEIRDRETADIAVNSAMTGHLVLSTLHTNDAATTLPRILDMDIEPFILASTVNIAIGQRLVRKICQKCIQSYETKIEDLQNTIPPDITQHLFGDKKNLLLYRGAGCGLCKKSGYMGRIGVFEILEIDDHIRQLIMKNADSETIKALAIKNGMTTMISDGIEKVINGITTIDELIRVVKY